MGLRFPPEPLKIKEDLMSVRSGDTPSSWDRLAVWASGISKYLWDHWGEDLKRMGYTWHMFSRVLSLHTDDIVEWGVYNRLSWNELIARVVDTLTKRAPKTE